MRYWDVVHGDMFSLVGHNVYQQDFSFDIKEMHILAHISHSGYEDVLENGLVSGSGEESAGKCKYHLIFKMSSRTRNIQVECQVKTIIFQAKNKFSR